MDKNVLLNCLSCGKALIESNAAFYVKEEKKKSAKSKSKTNRYVTGKKMEHHFIGIERAPDGNAVIEFAVPSRSEPGLMRHCFIDIIPKGTNLFTLAQTTKKLGERIKVLKEADVRCFCSCPDFNWSGMKWKMKHKYNSLSDGHHSDDPKDDNGEDIAPKVRTPHLCSHLIASFEGMLTNASSIMKQAREAKPAEQPEKPAPAPENPVVGKKKAEEKVADKKAEIDEINNPVQAEEERKEARQEAMDAFSEGEGGIKTEETQKALDALADNLEPGAQPSEQAEDNPGVGLIGKYDEDNETTDQNNVFNFEDDQEALPLFDMPIEEEPEESVDDEYIVGGPLELPKP